MVLAMRVVLASLFAGVLALMGLWAFAEGPARFGAMLPRWLWLVAGVTCLAMAQFVFAALVADRLFPHAAEPLVRGVEVVSGVVYLGGVVVLLAAAAGGVG